MGGGIHFIYTWAQTSVVTPLPPFQEFQGTQLWWNYTLMCTKINYSTWRTHRVSFLLLLL